MVAMAHQEVFQQQITINQLIRDRFSHSTSHI